MKLVQFICKAKQKNICVSAYMLFQIRVGRSGYYFFLFFAIILSA